MGGWNKGNKNGETRKCEVCGKEFYVYPYRKVGKYCSQTCYHNASRVKKACENCGKIIENYKTGKKYCCAKCASDHRRNAPRVATTGKDGYRYVWFADGHGEKEHRFLLENALGKKLNKDEVVHHIDGNKSNNDIGNLAVMTLGEHSRIHRIKENENGVPLFGGSNEKRKREVVGVGPDGETIKFNSLQDAKRAGFSHVVDCCQGKRKSDKGYRWRYAN